MDVLAGRELPGDLRRGRARSRDDRPVPRVLPGRGGGPVHLGAGAVRPAGHGPAGHGRAGRHEDRRERVEGGGPDRGGAAAARRPAGRRARGSRCGRRRRCAAGRRAARPPPGGPGRDARIAAALAQITAERQAAQRQDRERGQAYLAAQAAGRPGPPPAAAAVTAARARLDRARAARAAQLTELERRAAGPVVTGRRRDRPRTGVEDYCLVTAARQALDKARARQAETQRKAAASPRREPVRNITDPDSRLMPARSAFIQGYNAQNVTSADGLIIATQLTPRHYRHAVVHPDPAPRRGRRRADHPPLPRPRHTRRGPGQPGPGDRADAG